MLPKNTFTSIHKSKWTTAFTTKEVFNTAYGKQNKIRIQCQQYIFYIGDNVQSRYQDSILTCDCSLLIYLQQIMQRLYQVCHYLRHLHTPTYKLLYKPNTAKSNSGLLTFDDADHRTVQLSVLCTELKLQCRSNMTSFMLMSVFCKIEGNHLQQRSIPSNRVDRVS